MKLKFGYWSIVMKSKTDHIKGGDMKKVTHVARIFVKRMRIQRKIDFYIIQALLALHFILHLNLNFELYEHYFKLHEKFELIFQELSLFLSYIFYLFFHYIFYIMYTFRIISYYMCFSYYFVLTRNIMYHVRIV